MDKDKKKQLRNDYLAKKPTMGVFMYRCNPTGKVYLGYDQNLEGTFNGLDFQLNIGSYLPNSRLQNDWKKYGENNFTIETLEILSYDKEHPEKTNYKDDLQILRELWSEKFENVENIKK